MLCFFIVLRLRTKSIVTHIKYANYIRSAKGEGGLLGCINGISFTPDFAAGHFLDTQNEMIPMNA